MKTSGEPEWARTVQASELDVLEAITRGIEIRWYPDIDNKNRSIVTASWRDEKGTRRFDSEPLIGETLEEVWGTGDDRIKKFYALAGKPIP